MDQESTILIVDDEPAGRAVLKGMLIDDGYSLVYAGNGLEAIEMAHQHTPDLILLDVIMPGLSGFEVCRRLRADAQLAEVPIIIITALDDLESYLKAIEAGADDCISKPFDKIKLRARVRTITRLNRYRRLHKSQEQLREQAALLDIAQNAIIVCDLSGNIHYWNKSAEQIYGWTAAEVTGKKNYQFFNHNDANQFKLARATLLEKGRWTGELNQRTRNGEKLIVYSIWTLVRNNNGEAKSIFIVNADITEKQRLSELFYRTQRMETISALVCGIAHDLNNIFMPVLVSTRLLKKKSTDKDTLELLDLIESPTTHGVNLIKQILSFAREIELNTIIQPHQLITEIVKIIEHTFPAKVKIQCNCSDDLWLINGQVTPLHQVLLNICLNACDAMPDGGILNLVCGNHHIDEQAAQLNNVASGPYIFISISDTGAGIAAENLNKIFEPFFTTKAPGKGTGLGLSAAMDIVKSHGGSIQVKSNAGQGTEFKVYLPAIERAAQPQTGASMPDLFSGNGELVLVIDHGIMIQTITKTTLEAYGYRVIQADNGEDAIDIYQQNGSEIMTVLLDMEVRGLSAMATVLALKEINADVKIIITNDTADNKNSAEIITTDIFAFLPKPYSAYSLLQIIAEARNFAISPMLSNH